MAKTTYQLPVIIEKDGDGYYVYCPALEGCYTQGSTYEEALKNITEVIELCLEDDKETKKQLPDLHISMSSVAIAV